MLVQLSTLSTILFSVVLTSLGGFEPSTYGLEGRCSIQLSYRLISLTTPKTNCFRKAGDGNRTHVSSLEGWCSTIELHPRINCFLRFILYQNRSQSFQALRKRVMGIEPTYPAWKAGVLPLNYTRISIGVTGFEPATSWSQTRRSSQAEPHPVFCFRVVISVTQIVLYISPLYMSTTFLNFFQKNSSKYLPYFGKPVKSGFPDLLSSYLYTVLSSTSGCFPFSNFITM